MGTDTNTQWGPFRESSIGNKNRSLPTVTIVTPNRNGANYLEQTIRSVLDQEYQQLEYIVVDGASTDGSVDIIKKYAPRLAGWASEPDSGMYDAINKGFARSHGEIMAYLNSDDMYAPWTFQIVSELFSKFPQIEWLSSNYPSFWTKDGCLASTCRSGGINRGWIRSGYCLPGFGRSVIQQETTFWRRSLWERAKSHVDARYRLLGDAELWLRFSQCAEPYFVDAVLGGFRVHGAQLTRTQGEHMTTEAQDIAARYKLRQHPVLGMWWDVQRKFPWRLRQKMNGWLPFFGKMFFVRFDINCSEWKMERV